MYTNAKIRIHPAGIYLLKVNNENSRTKCVICINLTKKDTRVTSLTWRHQETLTSLWSLYCPTPFLSISFLNFGKCCWLGLPAETKEQTSKNYETFNDRCRLHHINQTGPTTTRKETVSNLLSMQSIGFEQTWNFVEIFLLQE